MNEKENPDSREPAASEHSEARAPQKEYRFGELRQLSVIEMVGLFTLTGAGLFTMIEPAQGGPCGY